MSDFTSMHRQRTQHVGNTRANSSAKKTSGSLSFQSKLLDVCLVAVWGLSIPGLMWLAAAGGF